MPENQDCLTTGCRPYMVQIGGVVENIFIDLDTLSIEQDSIPDGGCSVIFEPEGAEVELILANAMHQLDA